MKILQCGYDKSGNYWLWKILASTLDAAGIERSSFIRHQPIYSIARTWELSFPEQADVDMIAWRSAGNPRVDTYWWTILPMYKRRIQDLDAYVEQVTIGWSHTPFGPAAPECLRKFDKLVYIVRDPRDIVLSFADFVVTPFYLREYAAPTQELSVEDRIRKIAATNHKRWQQHVIGWLRQCEAFGVHVVFYERLVDDFDAEYQRLVDYLELELDDAAVATVFEATRKKSMRKKNFGHVNKGRIGRWLTDMPDHCARQITVNCFELLGHLGYSQMERPGELLIPGPVSAPLPETLQAMKPSGAADEATSGFDDIGGAFEKGFEDD